MNDRAKLRRAQMLRWMHQRVVIAFENLHRRRNAIERNQKIDVPGVLEIERTIGKLCQRGALQYNDGNLRCIEGALQPERLGGQNRITLRDALRASRQRQRDSGWQIDPCR